MICVHQKRKGSQLSFKCVLCDCWIHALKAQELQQETDPSALGVSTSSDKKKGFVFVYFFGTKKCGWVKALDCLNFFDNINLVFNQQYSS